MQSLQGAGAEGVIGGVPGLVAATTQADLERAAKQSEIQSQVDLQRAAGEQAIEARRQEREYFIGTQALQGAQDRRTQEQRNFANAIAGIGKGLETAVKSASGIGGGSTNNAGLGGSDLA